MANKMLLDTTHHRAAFRVGDCFVSTMGTHREGIVISPRQLPYEVKHELWKRPPFRSSVVPVKYSDNTFGYECRVHIRLINQTQQGGS